MNELRARFPLKKILSVTLKPPLEDGTIVHGVVTQLEEALGDSHPDAIFVFGLDAMFDPAAPSAPALDILNLNRDYLVKRFPCPVVFWIAEFGVRELMSRAPDFWAIRSGTYHFVGETEDARSTLERVEDGFDWNLGLREKHERAETLRHVLKEVESAAQPDLPVLAATLYQLGRALEFEGTAEDGGEHFARALALYREIDDRRGEANCLQRLGDAALQQSDYEGAERLYQQALAIWLQIGDHSGEASCALSLGQVARMQARYTLAILQVLLHPIAFLRHQPDQLLPPPGQFPQFAGRLLRNKARPYHPVPQQMRQPPGVTGIRLVQLLIARLAAIDLSNFKSGLLTERANHDAHF